MKNEKYKQLKDNGIENIHRLILHYIDISDAEWNYCKNYFNTAFYKKKELLLKQNDICGHIFFVVSGLLRIYFIDDKGEEKTFHFCLENTFGTDYESFLKNKPSNFSIQAMEDTVVIVITLDMLESFYKFLRYGDKLGRLIAEDYFFIINEKIRSMYVNTPLERYNTMNTRFPNILQRVPQHCIASYLNITSVHLSRLKYHSKEKK
ncbi:Crp/Fnr family transcriptional regulator [Flavobacterium gelatinilyticum]|uniref:Crp/Fnr family transcriptional regulator n=1 Tax=Flavobacterium gelatinilyticum TaxID=3003260 RepID=UPI002480579A|nr:Crp/Fnr family transcriptional regulator [Flavobacterium gelatinilyticum]